MARFLFYYGNDPSVASRVRSAAERSWGEIHGVALDGFHLFVARDHHFVEFCETPDIIGVVCGYVRHDSLSHAPADGHGVDWHHNRVFLSEILHHGAWPLGNDWTGSFTAVGFSRVNCQLVVCNDPIGYRPLYLKETPAGLIGATSLIAMSRCTECQADPIGVLQRITPPNYSQYGRRSLLQGVWRLLPGECVWFAPPGHKCGNGFDNSLYNGVRAGNLDYLARVVWDCIQREVFLATGIEEPISVGLSGGWDSRLVLAAVAHRGSAVHCYTYGNKELYEVKIAERCARAVGASHRAFGIEGEYFPERSRFAELVEQTEAATHMVWNTILSHLSCTGPSGGIFLLGDMCESIDGRDIVQFSSRGARMRSFWQGLVGREPGFAPMTDTAFQTWANATTSALLDAVLAEADNVAPSLLASVSNNDELVQQMWDDIQVSLSRIAGNMPPFACLADELFRWLHRRRYVLTDQNLLIDSLFRAFSPVMSLRPLRLITTIHPRLRLRRRLMDAIARLPELDVLSRIPSAQIPWLSARAPSLLREIVWGARSLTDQRLMRRILRTKNPRLRQRVLRSLDYLQEYRREGVPHIVRSWFSGRWVRPDYYVGLVEKRAAMLSWPLYSLDITAPANVSVILDACELP